VLRLVKDKVEAMALWTTGDIHESTVPLKAGHGTMVDMLGNRTGVSWPDDGLKISLSQGPQYLLIEAQ